MKIASLLSVWLLSLPLTLAAAAVFEVAELPNGKDITLGRHAVIRITDDIRGVTLQATDTPQTVSFTLDGTPPKGFVQKIGLFDKKQTRVQHIQLENGKTYLYTFSGLDSILVVPEAGNDKGKTDLGILIKSDKPLTLSH